MPIRKVSGGWQWGSHGHVYGSREGAEKQAAAAYAHGYKGDDKETAAAGVAITSPNGALLFLKRSGKGDHAGEWAFPGGHMETGETPLDCAMRETNEETGHDCEDDLMLVHRHDGFATFASHVATEFCPTLNEEHDEYRWAQPDQAPEPLHPGVKATLEMDAEEEEISRKIAQLVHEGYEQKQAIRIAYEEARHGGVHRDTAYFATEQLGKTRRLTPEGFLVCEGVPIARTGEQLYAAHELKELTPNGAGYIIVERPPEEVFHPDTLASFEGKDVVMNHPEDAVNVDTWKDLSVGHAQNIRRGTGIEDDLLLADLVIKIPEAIDYVNKRKPEVSAGYNADYKQKVAGRATQFNIRGNHIAALVGMSGRAGGRVAFRDAAIPPRPVIEEPAMPTKVSEKFWARLRSLLHDRGVKTADAEAVQASLATFDADESEYVDKSSLDKAIADALDRAFKARDAAAKEDEEKRAKDAKAAADQAAADKAAKDAAEKEEREKKEAESEKTGDTVLEAEGPGMTINLGKTWTGGMTGDASAQEPVLQAVVARAELLSPGIAKPTADSIKGNGGKVLATFMRDSLGKFMTDSAGAAIVQPLLLGQKVADLKGHALLGAFNLAANYARGRNNRGSTHGIVRGKTTGDFSPALMTNADLNEQAQAFWSNGGKLPANWKPSRLS